MSIDVQGGAVAAAKNDPDHRDRLLRCRIPLLSRSCDLRVLADEDLMQLAGDGDVRAFELVLDRHAAVACSLAYRMCRRQAMAEDIVQEAFLSLWRSGCRYDRARGTVRSWVLSVVHNRAVDALRRTPVNHCCDVRDEEIVERIAGPELTETEIVRREDARHVRRALEQLPPQQRQVIELAYFGGFTHSQIAQMLELPAGTVKGRMRLGLQKLRAVLEPGIRASQTSTDSSPLTSVQAAPSL